MKNKDKPIKDNRLELQVINKYNEISHTTNRVILLRSRVYRTKIQTVKVNQEKKDQRQKDDFIGWTSLYRRWKVKNNINEI